VDYLEYDLGDGILLINLIEILTSRPFPWKYNKHPRIRMQKLENLSLALRFLQMEGVKLVSIDADSIESGVLKLIVGFIWTIIIQYQLKVTPGLSCKAVLLEWVRNQIPEYNINNFRQDWQDGKAICALVEALHPGQMTLPRDFSNDPEANARMGMTKASQSMGIPQILDAEDMVLQPDELANMTYISFFRNYPGLQAHIIENWPKTHKQVPKPTQYSIEEILCCISQNYNIPKELKIKIVKLLLYVRILEECYSFKKFCTFY